MGLKDLLITPIFLIVIFIIARAYKSRITDQSAARFLLPAIGIKCFGAIMLGVIYQFYYGGGDTFNYWHFGSRLIWEAFLDNPLTGLGMIFGDIYNPDYYEYFSRIMLRRSNDTLFVIKVAGFFDLFTLHTYSSTALFFGFISFFGSWMFFRTVNQIFPNKTTLLFLAIFCFPSVVIWGAGVMKDSLALGSLLVAAAVVLQWIVLKKRNIFLVILFILSCWVLSNIRIYVLVIFIPVIFVQLFLLSLKKIKSTVLKIILTPILLVSILGSGSFVLNEVSRESDRYSLSSIPEWSAITANDLGYWTGKDAGSGYSLGYREGTWQDMLSKFFPAINVTLFRPYPWEVSSGLMAFAALESLLVFILTLYILVFKKSSLKRTLKDPAILSISLFVILFAFAVGVSSYNFGSLVRYKIPLLPFLGVVLGLTLTNHSKKLINKSS